MEAQKTYDAQNKAAAEKRAIDKKNTEEFNGVFIKFMAVFLKAEDDIPFSVRDAMENIKAGAYYKKLMDKVLDVKKTRAPQPTYEEKLTMLGTGSHQYRRCEYCEAPFQNRLAKNHYATKTCQNAVTTRLNDVKVRKEDKYQGVAARVPIKDRIAEIAAAKGWDEDDLKALIKENKKEQTLSLPIIIEAEQKKRGEVSEDEEEEEQEEVLEPQPEPEEEQEEVEQEEVIVEAPKKKRGRKTKEKRTKVTQERFNAMVDEEIENTEFDPEDYPNDSSKVKYARDELLKTFYVE